MIFSSFYSSLLLRSKKKTGIIAVSTSLSSPPLEKNGAPGGTAVQENCIGDRGAQALALSFRHSKVEHLSLRKRPGF